MFFPFVQFAELVNSMVEMRAMARREDPIREIEARIRYWHERGWIRWHALTRIEEDDTLRLRVQVRGEHGPTMLEHRLTTHEVVMGGRREVSRWLDTIEHHMHRTARSAHHVGRAADVAYQTQYRDEFIAAFEARESNSTREANAKAKELFARIAGADALAALEHGSSITVTGSKAGVYHLHKRATFSVTRLKDGAKLCAVVPGVPLYDHLLGIKLVIETDEPRFLKTANVAGGLMPGGITWVGAHEALQAQRAAERAAGQQEEAMVRMMVEHERRIHEMLINPPLYIRPEALVGITVDTAA